MRINLSLTPILLFVAIFGNSQGVFAAFSCSSIHSPIKHLLIAKSPWHERILLALRLKSTYRSAYVKSFQELQIQDDHMLALFASFQAHGISPSQQVDILLSHPEMIEMKVSKSLMKKFVLSYQERLRSEVRTEIGRPLIQMKTTKEVQDQCSSGSCWIQSSASLLSQLTGRNVSEAYLYACSLLDRGLRAADMRTPGPLEGGTIAEFLYLIQRYGYLEDKDWHVDSNIFKAAPEIKGKFEEAWVEYRKTDPSQHQDAKVQYLHRIYDILKPYLPPSARTFETRIKWIPQRLEIFDFDIVPESKFNGYVRQTSDRGDSPDSREQRLVSSATGSFETAVDLIMSQIDQSREVSLTVKSPRNRDLSQPTLLERPIRKDNFREIPHALTVVGYVADAKGQLLLLKVKNSWGTKSGDQGYLYLGREYLKSILEGFSYLKISEEEMDTPPEYPFSNGQEILLPATPIR